MYQINYFSVCQQTYVEIADLESNLFPVSVALNNCRTVTFLQILFLEVLHPFCT